MPDEQGNPLRGVPGPGNGVVYGAEEGANGWAEDQDAANRVVDETADLQFTLDWTYGFTGAGVGDGKSYYHPVLNPDGNAFRVRGGISKSGFFGVFTSFDRAPAATLEVDLSRDGWYALYVSGTSWRVMGPGSSTTDAILIRYAVRVVGKKVSTADILDMRHVSNLLSTGGRVGELHIINPFNGTRYIRITTGDIRPESSSVSVNLGSSSAPFNVIYTKQVRATQGFAAWGGNPPPVQPTLPDPPVDADLAALREWAVQAAAVIRGAHLAKLP